MDDDGISDVEAESGTRSGRLGREERVEHSIDRLRGDARSVVLDFDDHLIILRKDSDLDEAVTATGVVDGVGGIVQQIRPHLVQLAAVGMDGGKVGGVHGADIDVPELRGQDEEGVIDAG